MRFMRDWGGGYLPFEGEADKACVSAPVGEHAVVVSASVPEAGTSRVEHDSWNNYKIEG